MAFFAIDGGTIAVPYTDIPTLKNAMPEATEIPNPADGQSLVQLSHDAGGHAIVLPTADLPILASADPNHTVIAHGTAQGVQLAPQNQAQMQTEVAQTQKPTQLVLHHDSSAPVHRGAIPVRQVVPKTGQPFEAPESTEPLGVPDVSHKFVQPVQPEREKPLYVYPINNLPSVPRPAAPEGLQKHSGLRGAIEDAIEHPINPLKPQLSPETEQRVEDARQELRQYLQTHPLQNPMTPSPAMLQPVPLPKQPVPALPKDVPIQKTPKPDFSNVVLGSTLPALSSANDIVPAINRAFAANKPVDQTLADLKETVGNLIGKHEAAKAQAQAEPKAQPIRWSDLPDAPRPAAAPTMNEIAKQPVDTHLEKIKASKAGDAVAMMNPAKTEVKLVPSEYVPAMMEAGAQIARAVQSPKTGQVEFASYTPVQIPVIPPPQAPQVQSRGKKSDSDLQARLAKLEEFANQLMRGKWQFGTRPDSEV